MVGAVFPGALELGVVEVDRDELGAMQLGHLEHVDADPAGRADHHDALARLDAGPRPADVDRGTDGVRDGGGGYVVDAVRQGEQGVLRQLDEFGVAAVDVTPDVAAEVVAQ